MNDFYFHLNTKFYFGRGVAADIAEEILSYGRKVFFIYDEIPAKTSGAYELIHKVCGENGIEVTDFTGIEPNPSHQDDRPGESSAQRERRGCGSCAGRRQHDRLGKSGMSDEFV